MKRIALVLALAFVLGACGEESSSFDADPAPLFIVVFYIEGDRAVGAPVDWWWQTDGYRKEFSSVTMSAGSEAWYVGRENPTTIHAEFRGLVGCVVFLVNESPAGQTQLEVIRGIPVFTPPGRIESCGPVVELMIDPRR